MKAEFQYTAPVIVTLHAAYMKMLYSWMMWNAIVQSRMGESIEIVDLFTPGATKAEFYSDSALSMLREFHRYFLYSDKGPKDVDLLKRLKTTDSQRQALTNFRNCTGFHISEDMFQEIDVTEKLASESVDHKAYYEDMLIIGQYIQENMGALDDTVDAIAHLKLTIANLEKSVSVSDKYTVTTCLYPMS
jgi:hypothetical protein